MWLSLTGRQKGPGFRGLFIQTHTVLSPLSAVGEPGGVALDQVGLFISIFVIGALRQRIAGEHGQSATERTEPHDLLIEADLT